MKSQVGALGLVVIIYALCGCGGGDGGGSPEPMPSGSIVWEKTVGGAGDEEAHAIQATSDGGYIVVGSTTSFGAGDSDLYLVKFDADGAVVWEKTYGGAGSDTGSSVAPTDDGGYIAAGAMETASEDPDTRAFAVFLVKTEATGSLIWERAYRPTHSYEDSFLFQNDDGGYTFAGVTYDPAQGPVLHGDLYVLTVDPEGEVVSEHYPQSGDYLMKSILGGRTLSDGGYELFIYNDYYIKPVWSGINIAKFDSQGNRVDTISLEQSVGAVMGLMIGTPEGYVLIPKAVMGLITFDSAGKQIIQNSFAGNGYSHSSSIVQTADGGYLLAGDTQTDFMEPRDVYLVRTDAAGQEIWEIIHGGEGDDAGGPMAQSSDGGYVVAGTTTSFGAGGRDLYILKVEER